MDNLKSTTHTYNQPITEGYLAGGAALMVAVLWLVFDVFHPLMILALYTISFFCLSITTLWLLSKDKTIKDWFSGQPVRFISAGILGLFFVLSSLGLILYT
jgi:hypothetical protein